MKKKGMPFFGFGKTENTIYGKKIPSRRKKC